MTSTSKITSKTIDGLMEFCDYLADKGLATAKSMENWKTATRTVFSSVEGESYGATELADLDLDEFLQRFETLTLGKYKPESLTAYGSRVRSAIDAYMEYVETGQTPKLRKPLGSTTKPKMTAAKRSIDEGRSAGSPPTGELIKFPFPLQNGEMATLQLPRRLQKEDADRLSAFLRTLQAEGQPQIPQHTGEEEAAA